MNIEKFNKNGLQDGYRVLKYLQEQKDKLINARKGGKIMADEDNVLHPEDEVMSEPAPNAEAAGDVTCCDPVAEEDARQDDEARQDETDLAEPVEGDA